MMLTLKDKINRILGNNVRLLLPSYWWKRLFGMVVDRIDEVHPFVDSAAALDKLDVPDGSIASITGEQKSFRTCYQIPEEILSGSGDDDDLLPELPKLTRINNISILNPLPSEAILIILCERDKLSISGLFLTPDLSYFSSSYEGVVTKIIIAEGGVVNPAAESQINNYLEKNELCYVYANTDSGGVNTSATYDIVDKVLKQGVRTDVYIKDEEWQPLARRKELDSLRTSIEGIEESGVKLRDLYIKYDDTLTELTDEQKAWNLETLELAKQGKAIVRVTLYDYTFILEMFNEDAKYQFGYTHFSTSGGFSIYVVVAEDGLARIEYKEYNFDSELSDTSENPVQNKAIKAYVDAEVAKKQNTLISGTNIKTINGTSILGSGNITISGGSSSGSGAYAEVNHGTSDTTFALTPNTFHVWEEVSALTLTLGSETAGVANEYLFQFTSGATATTLTLPDDIKWANDSAPTIAENMIYQVSILKGLASVLEFSYAPEIVLIQFSVDGQTHNAEEGMTWATWVNSSYTNGFAHISGNIVYWRGLYAINGVLPTDTIIANNTYTTYMAD